MNPPTPEQIREAWATIAETLAGLSAPDERYREVVGPERIEGQQLSIDMMKMWSCALTWLGLARIMGEGNETSDPELERKYVIGAAMTDVERVLTRHGAWHPTWSGVHRLDPIPGKGDCVLIGAGGYHCRACIVSDVGPNGEVDIVEGGHMTDKGLMCISRVLTRLFVQDGVLYCGATASTSSRVYGWGDCTSMPQPNLRTDDEDTKALTPTDDGNGTAEGG